MKLANDYLSNEISRMTKIIRSNEETIRLFRCGRATLISATGKQTTDPRTLLEYIDKKKAQLNKMKGWKNHVSRYMC